jgi:hypothetical protein
LLASDLEPLRFLPPPALPEKLARAKSICIGDSPKVVPDLAPGDLRPIIQVSPRHKLVNTGTQIQKSSRFVCAVVQTPSIAKLIPQVRRCIPKISRLVIDAIFSARAIQPASIEIAINDVLETPAAVVHPSDGIPQLTPVIAKIVLSTGVVSSLSIRVISALCRGQHRYAQRQDCGSNE